MKSTINLLKYVILPVCCLVLITSCEPPTLVTIEDKDYSVAEFKENYEFEPTDDSLQRHAKVDEYVDQLLMMHEARNQGYEDDPVVIEAFKTHRKDIISRGYYEKNVIDKVKVSEAELRARYYKMVETYHLAQIVCDEETVAVKLQRMLDSGVPFDSLLRFSLDTLTENGDIGEFSADQLPPEIFDALSKTREGKTTEPILFGEFLYILKVIEHKTADTPTYSDIKESIRRDLSRQQIMELAEKFVDKVIQEARIEYNPEGLEALIKPDSLLTQEDLNTWVVQKYDTAFVYVHALRQAVFYQYQQSNIDPKRLIDRVLVPELIYDQAVQAHYDKSTEVNERLDKALSLLMYQKYYSDNIIEKVQVDSAAVEAYYKKNQSEYPDRTLAEVFTLIFAKLRDDQVADLRSDLVKQLRDRYVPVVNDQVVQKALKEE